MENSCQKNEEQILELIAGILPAEKRVELERHISQCAACSEYLRGLEADDKLLGDFAEAMQPRLSQLEEKAIDAIGGEVSSKTVGPDLVWQRIIKSSIGKLAAAAVIILIAVFGITVLDKSTASAWAIEQTIEALQSVTTVHVIGTDWDGNRYEAWNKINPETGKAEWVCIDQTPHGYKIASTPKGSCVWDKDGNVIRYTNQVIASNDFRYGHVFEELSNRLNNPSDDEQITVYREIDRTSAKEVIVIWAITKMQDYKIYIDPVTKLPIRTYYDRADNMVQIAKSADQIFYNVELPEGMFDFEIPAERVKDYSVLEDPEKGMPAEGSTIEQASIRIAEGYWNAAIAGDWDTFRQLAPVDESWRTGFRRNPPVELIEVKQPYPERGCSGLIVPCIVRFKDGEVKESKAVVNYREIDGQPSCIIVAWWGKSRLIE